MGKGVEGEDGGDGLIDVLLHASQLATLGWVFFGEQLHLGRRQRKKDGFKQGAKKGNEQSAAYGEDKNEQQADLLVKVSAVSRVKAWIADCGSENIGVIQCT